MCIPLRKAVHHSIAIAPISCSCTACPSAPVCRCSLTNRWGALNSRCDLSCCPVFLTFQGPAESEKQALAAAIQAEVDKGCLNMELPEGR